MLTALRPAGSSPSTMLTVAKRALNATSGQFMPVNPDLQTVRELPEDRIQIQNVNQLDGQYIVLVTQPKAVGASKSDLFEAWVNVLTRSIAISAANFIAGGRVWTYPGEQGKTNNGWECRALVVDGAKLNFVINRFVTEEHVQKEWETL